MVEASESLSKKFIQVFELPGSLFLFTRIKLLSSS